MALKPKVTVASVKRKWEEKYNELNAKYEDLCQAHIDMARAADEHSNAEAALQKCLDRQNELAYTRLVEIHRLQGIVIYLENKLNGND